MIEFVILFLSMIFLGAGYILRSDRMDMQGKKYLTQRIHPLILAAIGWLLFGVFWLFHFQDYREADDMVNALISLGAFPFFAYIAFREIESIPRGGCEGLRFLSGITVISMTGYTLVSEVPVLELSLEYINACLVSGFLTLSGFPSEAGGVDFSGNPLLFRSNDHILAVPILHDGHNEILITLSCTAISSMFLFSAAILSAREPGSIKLRTALLIIPTIFILNIVRMSMITYFTYTGLTSPEFAHHILGKAGSLLVLLFLAWVLFTFLPSVLDSVSEVFDILSGKKIMGKGEGSRRKYDKREKIR